MDQKSTNMYDIKLAEYAQPICVDNLDIDTQYSAEHYHTDQLFNEELKALSDGGAGAESENDNDKFRSPGDALGGRQAVEPAKQSKEYVEVNFQFNYSGDDESPIKVGIDVNAGPS